MRVAALGSALWLLLTGAGAILPDETALESIRVEDLKTELRFLASDELQGRAIQTPFNEVAARYLARRFEGMGLLPAADGSFFQEFQVVRTSFGRPLRAAILGRSGEAMRRLEIPDDYFPAPLSADGRVSAPVVFAGYGISAPDRGHDDYQELDVTGKIVLILDDEPEEYVPESRFDGLVMTDYGRELQKLWTAQQRGAVGVLIAPDIGHHGESPMTRRAARIWPEDPAQVRPQLQVQLERIRIPAAYVSAAVAEDLVKSGGRDLETLHEQTERRRRPPEIRLQSRAELEVSLQRKAFTVQNVLAYLPGTDPELKSQLVIMGAHFDHVGADGDVIFNGADDNASGTVGLLEIAEAYAASQRGPRRSVLFAAWNAEERGLLGSYYYVDRPVFPLENTVAMFQMDMIGRDEEIPERKGYRFRGLETQSPA